MRVLLSPWRVLNCITKNNFISPAQPPLIWWVEAEKSVKLIHFFVTDFPMDAKQTRQGVLLALAAYFIWCRTRLL